MIKSETNDRLRRQANSVFKPIKSETPVTDYAKAQQSIQENRERLKAERLARDVNSKDAEK